jgi:hypothetical protein
LFFVTKSIKYCHYVGLSLKRVIQMPFKQESGVIF